MPRLAMAVLLLLAGASPAGAEPVKKGELELRCEHGAVVFVDGQDVGTCLDGAFTATLVAGEHEVVIESSTRNRRWFDKVTVEPGRTNSVHALLYQKISLPAVAAGVANWTATSPMPPLARSLTQADIQGAVQQVSARVLACGAKNEASGRVKVRVVVSGAGDVIETAVEGAFAGTPTGDCVEKVMSGATFPVWKGPKMTFKYPFVFR